MPESLTTPGRPSTCVGALDHVAFRHHNGFSAQDIPIAAQWLAYAIPYDASPMASRPSAHGSGTTRVAIIVSHRLFLAGLRAHYDSNLKKR